MNKKRTSGKHYQEDVCKNETIKIVKGVLTQSRGRSAKTENLFELIGEKIPFELFKEVKNYVLKNFVKGSRKKVEGVYIAHDSYGNPKYIGRGSIFSRLQRHKNKHGEELQYFSFYIVKQKIHEREIETLLIHTTSDLLDLNSKKKKTGINPGRVLDYEAKTFYLEQRKMK